VRGLEVAEVLDKGVFSNISPVVEPELEVYRVGIGNDGNGQN
jgi:hypothetical protein